MLRVQCSTVKSIQTADKCSTRTVSYCGHKVKSAVSKSLTMKEDTSLQSDRRFSPSQEGKSSRHITSKLRTESSE